jgi:hypothetical protein
VSGPRGDWDDARLDAAFAARQAQAAAAPGDLVGATLDGIRHGPTARATGRLQRLAPILGLAAALAVVVGLAAGRLGTSPPAASATPESPSGSSSAPSPSTTAIGPAGQPLTVSAALAVRAVAGDDREVAVAGFLSPWFAIPCPELFPIGSPPNPTRLACPDSFQYLMEQPESLRTTTGATTKFGPPGGPAIHPSFALVTRPDVPDSGGLGPSNTAPVVLVGHFDDRRAALCPADSETECADVFVVDQVVSVAGRPVGVATQTDVTEQPIDLQEDVDSLVLGAVPGGAILSRQLVTVDHVSGIEPVLADDPVISHWSNPADLMWIVTILDSSQALPKARTFALIDGTNWFAEITATGAVKRERSILGPQPPSSRSPGASADPTAFDTAPTSVVGIKVRDVATVMQDRQASVDDLGRDEFAIRAWYVAPNPSAICSSAAPPIHPPTPPCDEARPWLLDDPTQLGSEVGQVRRDPEHWPRVLNPLLPVDVPFDVAATRMGTIPDPQPVVVLGHFADDRVETYAGNVYLVLDALVWTRDRPVAGIDTVARLTGAATEDPARVRARIEAESGQPAIVTWMTVVDAADFATLDPHTAVIAPELTTGHPVWIVRRLIRNEMDGRDRLAVEWGYTADGGHRVWLGEPDSSPDLATTFDLPNLDARTDLVRVFDLDDQVAGVRSTAGLSLAWQRVEPKEARLEVARGTSTREVALRWTSAVACVREWDIRVEAGPDGAVIVRVQALLNNTDCSGDDVRRSIAIEFDHPVDLDQVTTIWDPGLG